MKRVILCFFLLILVKAAGQNRFEDGFFVPDTSINNVLFLLNKESIVKTIGDQKGKLIDDENPSRIQLKNKSGTQYLILYHLNGANANTFNLFEIGYLSNKTKEFSSSVFNCFVTHDSIKLGISKATLIKLKGNNFQKHIKQNYEILEYNIVKPTDLLLIRYNMKIYTSQYFFVDDKLNKIIIGFPNL